MLLRFLSRRLAATVVLAFGVVLASFALTNVVPGDPAAANLGQQALEDPEVVAAFRAANGLDQPLPVQFARYLGNLVQGDLGTSQQSRRPVLTDLGEYGPASAELALVAVVVSLVIGVGCGTWAALRRDRPVDQIFRVLSLGGVSVPLFWLALIAVYVFSFRLGWFPAAGRLDPGQAAPPDVTGMFTVDALLAGDLETFGSAVEHVILPALVLAAFTIGLLTRFARSSVLEILGQDYVRAAHAKGLPMRLVVRRHVMRGALVPIITVVGTAFASLLAGTVLVERIFAWPGIGSYAYRSATTLDLPAIMGVSLFVAFVYILVNLVVDVLYGFIDPRIRTA